MILLQSFHGKFMLIGVPESLLVVYTLFFGPVHKCSVVVSLAASFLVKFIK